MRKFKIINSKIKSSNKFKKIDQHIINIIVKKALNLNNIYNTTYKNNNHKEVLKSQQSSRYQIQNQI